MIDKISLMKEALLGITCTELLPSHKWSSLTELSARIVTRLNKSAADSIALESIFNKMNGFGQTLYYEYRIADEKAVYPTDKAISPSFDIEKYKQEISQFVSSDDITDIGRILEVTETYTSFLPASYFGDYGNGISWYDHIRMVCSVSSCLYDYMKENSYSDITSLPFSELCSMKLFLLYSFDTSGIQKFIYTITNSGALKGLRARSFYLEMLMEILICEFLKRVGLSKANLIYSGGGHAYLLLPNTSAIKAHIDSFMKELKAWLMETFSASLFIADGYSECSADSLANTPEGSYSSIFRSISEKISAKKMNRYSAHEIIRLNTPLSEHTRECKICHRSDMLDKEDKCRICQSIESAASDILKNDFFAIWKNHPDKSEMLPLPFNLTLSGESVESLDWSCKQGIVPEIILSKNRTSRHYSDANTVNIGDYASSSSFEDLIKHSEGIKRLGVLRADVDNLGQAFVSGYPKDIMTLSRTSAFSRIMSKFFKLNINDLLRNGTFDLKQGHSPAPRNAAIVYSGGDDVFIVGSWDDIIGLSVDLYNSFRKYTQDTLSISAGIGMYHEKYPISSMAQSSGELEEYSKQLDGKNAVTLFDNSNRYKWDVFIEKVVGEKMQSIILYMNDNEGKGNAMLYQMLALVRGVSAGERLNIPRFAYLLGRLRPEKETSKETSKLQRYEKKVKSYKQFADSVYTWIRNDEDRDQLITALQLYIYLTRKEEDKNE